MLGFEDVNTTHVTSLSAGGRAGELCLRVGYGSTRDKLSPVRCFNDHVQKPLRGAAKQLCERTAGLGEK